MVLPTICWFVPKPLLAADAAGDESSLDEPFHPSWSTDVKFSHLGEGAQQVSNVISFDVMRDLTEAGSNYSASFGVGRQKQEHQKNGRFASLTLEGGLGFGDFVSSASLNGDVGNNRTQNLTAGLGLDYKLLDVLTIGVGGTDGPQSHEGPLSGLLSGNSNDKGQARLISNNRGWTGSCSYEGPWSWLSLSAMVGRSWNKSLRVEGPNGKLKKELDVTGHEDSIQAGPTFQIDKHWSIETAWVAGKDVSPGAGYYNPRTGDTTVLGTASTSWYRGFSTALEYLF
jgi:hypothetical protein